jgi:glucose-1-phosphatase
MAVDKVVIFDFGNVIINIDQEKTYQAFSDLTFKSAAQVKKIFEENQVFRNFEIGKFDETEFKDVIRQVLGYPLNDSEIEKAWNTLLLDIPKERWLYLEEIRSKVPIYLLSNTNFTHIEFCKKYISKRFGIPNFLNFFEKSYLSYELGLYKPSYEIYDYVLKDIGIEPQNVIFFDDNADNIAAALDLGINAIKIDPPEDFMKILDQLI